MNVSVKQGVSVIVSKDFDILCYEEGLFESSKHANVFMNIQGLKYLIFVDLCQFC